MAYKRIVDSEPAYYQEDKRGRLIPIYRSRLIDTGKYKTRPTGKR